VYIILSSSFPIWYKDLGWYTTANVIKPLQLQQNKIIRVCLGKKKLVESTVLNYNELNILRFKLIYQKFAILWVVKNIISTWYNINKIENRRRNRTCNAPVAYTNTAFVKDSWTIY